MLRDSFDIDHLSFIVEDFTFSKDFDTADYIVIAGFNSSDFAIANSFIRSLAN